MEEQNEEEQPAGHDDDNEASEVEEMGYTPPAPSFTTGSLHQKPVAGICKNHLKKCGNPLYAFSIFFSILLTESGIFQLSTLLTSICRQQQSPGCFQLKIVTKQPFIDMFLKTAWKVS